MPETAVKSIKGFNDTLPPRSRLHRTVEDTAARVFELYGYSPVSTPALEFLSIFERAAGASSDLVEKEMYSFTDRDGSQITLRPEGTAGVARAFIEHSLGETAYGKKVYYTGAMFRHERPQKGRLREFRQTGAEFFGSSAPSADAEVIAMQWHFFTALGIENGLTVEINSIGTPDDRDGFKTALRQFFAPLSGTLCADCKRRLQTNPLRVLDCKKELCEKAAENAPEMAEYLSPESAAHFEGVQKHLNALSVPFTVNGRIVRGLDYYTRTVFETKAASGLGAQNAVAAGGRYDLLVEALGGAPTPATGFAVGVERVVLLLEEAGRGGESAPAVFAGWIGEECFGATLELSATLRKAGIRTVMEHSGSIKSQMKKADRSGARFAAIIGPQEKQKGTVKLRDMESGDERELPANGPAASGATASGIADEISRLLAAATVKGEREP